MNSKKTNIGVATNKIRLLKLHGTPYEIGFQHGAAYKDDIHRYVEERVGLVCDGRWSGGPLPREEVLAIADACMPDHEAYAPDLVEEMRGMAAATGLSMAELLIVSGFTDFVDTVYATFKDKQPELARLPIDDCTAFLVPNDAAEGAAFFGQTWDMHDTATEFVVLLEIEPENGPKAIVFTTVGSVGQIGMNEHGICIGINNLLGADGQAGVTWPFVVRKALQQDNIEDALACVTEAKLSGAHNYLIMDKDGRGYNVEAMSTHQYITKLGDEIVTHTNHCLIPETLALQQTRLPAAQASSENRLNKANELLQQRPVTIDALIELTRSDPICTLSYPPFNIETCGAAIMRPKTGDFWAVWGLPSENEYEHFTL